MTESDANRKFDPMRQLTPEQIEYFERWDDNLEAWAERLAERDRKNREARTVRPDCPTRDQLEPDAEF
ncbi:hypothetical protein V0288_08365 [Pannus brasiliensis CCIBt3594]|uniref:Uncharacterized protein n=1 Tax=Pannus brasiliensis CCIBt3594 TaxID=1427578 RepID=A0AAW9QWL7_9CHRO